MEEVSHIINILEETLQGIKNEDSSKLRDISNKTIHSASILQDAGSVTLAVIIYAISKLIERKDNRKIKEWPKFVRRFNGFFELAIKALKENNFEKYDNYLNESRKSLASLSLNLKPYIQEVMRKASVNKASKIYEHGISMGHTAQLLGITQWELAEYAGQKVITKPYGEIIDTKERAKIAMEFFS